MKRHHLYSERVESTACCHLYTRRGARLLPIGMCRLSVRKQFTKENKQKNLKHFELLLALSSLFTHCTFSKQ